MCGVRAAARRLRSLAHDDVDGLAQVARRFPEDFLAIARADTVEPHDDRVLQFVQLGDIGQLAAIAIGHGCEVPALKEKIRVVDVLRIDRDAEGCGIASRFFSRLVDMGSPPLVCLLIVPYPFYVPHKRLLM